MIARVEYRVLNLSERGLLYSMRLECWVNHSLPSNPETLAKFIGLPADEVSAALPAVMPFFAESNGLLVSPELEDYRAHLAGIRVKQSNGGKRSAANKKASRKTANSIAAQGITDEASNLQATCKPPESYLQVLSSLQHSQVKTRKAQSLDEEHQSFVADYERASNGS